MITESGIIYIDQEPATRFSFMLVTFIVLLVDISLCKWRLPPPYLPGFSLQRPQAIGAETVEG